MPETLIAESIFSVTKVGKLGVFFQASATKKAISCNYNCMLWQLGLHVMAMFCSLLFFSSLTSSFVFCSFLFFSVLLFCFLFFLFLSFSRDYLQTIHTYYVRLRNKRWTSGITSQQQTKTNRVSAYYLHVFNN